MKVITTIKQITLTSVLLFLSYMMPNVLKAQDGYTYTLAHIGGYDFTVQAVPNASTNNFVTSVQSYGFTILVPDGVTITVNSSLGSSANSTFFDGTAVGQSTIDGYLITETLGSPTSLTAPSAGTNSDMLSFTVNGTPTSGEVKILENNAALATTITALKSFMQADMIDNGMAEYVNVVDPNAAAVSGMSSFMFSTLSIDDTSETNQLAIYPNPVSDILYIKGIANTLKSVRIIDINGREVIASNAIEYLDVSNLQSGLYIIELATETRTEAIKFIKK